MLPTISSFPKEEKVDNLKAKSGRPKKSIVHKMLLFFIYSFHKYKMVTMQLSYTGYPVGAFFLRIICAVHFFLDTQSKILLFKVTEVPSVTTCFWRMVALLDFLTATLSPKSIPTEGGSTTNSRYWNLQHPYGCFAGNSAFPWGSTSASPHEKPSGKEYTARSHVCITLTGDRFDFRYEELGRGFKSGPQIRRERFLLISKTVLPSPKSYFARKQIGCIFLAKCHLNKSEQLAPQLCCQLLPPLISPTEHCTKSYIPL